MRVISGSARGMRLVALEGATVRPTLDRVRESLFNILAPRIEGAHVLDLFAGTGALAIEALSRGAASAVLVEWNAAAIRVIEKNLAHTRLADRAACRRLNLPTELERLPGRFDIVFCDPPYTFAETEALFTTLQDKGMLAPDGLVLFEYHSKMPPPQSVGALHITRVKTYGQTALAFYEYQDGEQAPV
jgi:16S rRNA (guanine966-N2)-methyltransferase